MSTRAILSARAILTQTPLYIETSKDPIKNIFKMLQDKWSKINDIEMSSLFQPVYDAPKELLEFYKTYLSTTFLREDYHEVVQICFLYLGTDYSVNQFRKPDRIIRAKWMLKLLYSFKLVLLSTQIENLNILNETDLL